MIDDDKIKLIETKAKGNARKFFHFSKINDENDYYLIVHINRIQGVNNPKIKTICPYECPSVIEV